MCDHPLCGPSRPLSGAAVPVSSGHSRALTLGLGTLGWSPLGGIWVAAGPRLPCGSAWRQRPQSEGEDLTTGNRALHPTSPLSRQKCSPFSLRRGFSTLEELQASTDKCNSSVMPWNFHFSRWRLFLVDHWQHENPV